MNGESIWILKIPPLLLPHSIGPSFGEFPWDIYQSQGEDIIFLGHSVVGG